MKLVIFLSFYIVVLLFVIPSSFSFSAVTAEKINLKNNLDNKLSLEPVPKHLKVEIPESLKPGPFKKDVTVTYEDPFKTAFLLNSFYYDMDTYKCKEGIQNGLELRKHVANYMNTYKQAHNSNSTEVAANTKSLSETITNMAKSMQSLFTAKCAAFLIAEAHKWRRVVFFMSLRYKC
jgi:hypothetical protein